jgi:hypothetical protein
MKILALSLLVISCLVIVESCTCPNTQIEQFLNDSTTFPYVAKVSILSKVDKNSGSYNDDKIRYRAQVLTVYNGCLKIGKCPIILETGNVSAECGRPLDDCIGKEYVISFRTGSTNCKNTYDFNLCDYHALYTDLQNTDDMWILNNWKNDYLGVCATGNEVLCLLDPCSNPAPEGCNTSGQCKCTSNYCNGCNALWWNPDGTISCHTTDTATHTKPIY